MARSRQANNAALRLEWRTPEELADNPRNWRRHPRAQLAALKDQMAAVGWAGALLYNERTGHLLDGHARKGLAAPGEKLPVLVGSWPEDQERLILATLDPLAAMAQADQDPLVALLGETETASEAIRAMLEALANGERKPMPEWHNPDSDHIAKAEAELLGHFAGRGRDMVDVTCPHCLRNFSIARADMDDGE
jgi:hypothetical protein